MPKKTLHRKIRRTRPDPHVIDLPGEGRCIGSKHNHIIRAILKNVPVNAAGIRRARIIQNLRIRDLLVVEIAVRESDAAVRVQVACAAAVLEIVDGESGTDFLGGAGDADVARLEKPGGAVGYGGWHAFRCDS